MDEETQSQNLAEPSTNGLYCFIDADRPCSPECMAYTSQQSESPTLGMQQKNCSLIVGVERLGRFAGGIVQLLKRAQSDAQREAGTKPPPSPMGGSR